MRVAIYARYSSDNQRDASIDDQIRECRQFAQKEGWKVEEAFSDYALTGDNAFRPGFQALIREARRGRFDIVLGESLDRFSRDQEDTAALFKRLSFAGVRFVTLSEGDITPAAHRAQGHDECAVPQGSGGQDAARTSRPRRAWRLWWWAFVRLSSPSARGRRNGERPPRDRSRPGHCHRAHLH